MRQKLGQSLFDTAFSFDNEQKPLVTVGVTISNQDALVLAAVIAGGTFVGVSLANRLFK